MSRDLVLCVLVVLTSACATLQNTVNAAGRGDVGGAVQGASQLEAQRAKLQAEADKCTALEKKAVTYEEEYQIGGAVALALAKTSGGVFIELSPDIPAGPLQAAAWVGKKPTPGTGEKTDLTRYLNELGKSLAAFSARPGIEWTFVVLDSPAANAFSAPGGYVFITTGMLKTVDNEAQLAGVLSHEIGHVAGRHAINSYRSTKANACKAAFLAKVGAAAAADSLTDGYRGMLNGGAFDLDKASGDLIVNLTDSFFDELSKHGLDSGLEYDADKTALDLMVFGGYDPRELSKLLGKLPADGGFLTPHPANKDRIAKLDAALKAEYGGFSFDGAKAPLLGDKLKALKK